MAQPVEEQGVPSAFEMVEEATALLRHSGPATWAIYLIGTIPFVLGALFYWADMSTSPVAAPHLLESSFGVMLLYVWMCCWQAIYAHALLARRAGREPDPWDRSRIRRLILVQASWQPSALAVLPAAAIIALPFGWVYAFYENLTVIEGLPSEAAKRAREQARRWPWQNHQLLAVISFFAFAVFLNVLILVLLWPMLVRMFTGVDSVGDTAMTRLNSTTLMAVTLLTYLAVDPLAKACYVLRCFYGDSRRSGADLRAALGRLAKTALVAIGALLVAGGSAQGQDTERIQAATSTVSAPELRRSLDRVIHRREYTWRMPRTGNEPAASGHPVGSFLSRLGMSVLRGIVRGLSATYNWLRRLVGQATPEKEQGVSREAASATQLQRMLYVLSVVFAGALLAMWLRLRTRRKPGVVTAAPLRPVIDLTSEELTADQLPESGWMSLAQEWIDKQDLRMALRALYLASLANLARRELIVIHPAKSNADYVTELRRRSRAVPELGERLKSGSRIFERIWYGSHVVTPAIFEEFRSDVQALRSDGAR